MDVFSFIVAKSKEVYEMGAGHSLVGVDSRIVKNKDKGHSHG